MYYVCMDVLCRMDETWYTNWQGITVVINVLDCFKPVQARTNNTTNPLNRLYHTG